MFLFTIKRGFLLAVVFVSLLMGLLLLTSHTSFAQSPSATLNPTFGPPGTNVTATGSGWKAGHTFQAVWNGEKLLVRSTVRSDGGFAVRFLIPNSGQGSQLIIFKDLTDGVTSVQTVFTVTG